MERKLLKDVVQKLNDLIIPIEKDLKAKFLEHFNPLDCLIHLWSNLSKTQFENLFKSQVDDSKLKEIIKLLKDFYEWKIIDNQYDPKNRLLHENTMNNALKNLVKFIKKEETMDICTGFFRPNVWELIGEDFKKLHGLRLLIGSEYTIPEDSTERIQNVFQDLLIADMTYLEKSYTMHKVAIEETSLDEWDLTISILNLLEFLKKDTVDVKLQNYPFQHGKLYLTNQMAYLGSSNFTTHGLVENSELNIQIQEKRLLKKLKKWYERQWENGTPYKEKLIDLIERSKFGNHEYSPFEVYMKISFEQYKDDFIQIIKEGKILLAQFQAEGASKALKTIKKFGGVMIADAVGLGKSFTAMSVLENLQFYRGLVICPAQLRTKWEGYMEAFPACRVYSMEEMSLDLPRKKDETPMDYDVVLIDESHNFRNIGTGRYNNLLTLLEHCANVKLVLLTATPINTSLMDLYHQLMLICGRGKGFPSLGIMDLQEHFKKIENGETSIDLIKQNLMVAHSRAMIRNRQKVHHIDIMLPNNTIIEFPDRTLRTIRYELIPMSQDEEIEYRQKLEEWSLIQEKKAQKEELHKTEIESKRPLSPSEKYYQKVFDTLDQLNLVPFNLEKYKKQDLQVEQVLLRNRGIVAMLRTMLLKRMESSIYSFIESLEIQVKLCELFENLLEKGYVATSEFIRKLEDSIERSEDNDELGEEDSKIGSLVQFVESLTPEMLETMRVKKLSEEELEKRNKEDIYYKYLKRIEPNDYIEEYKEKMVNDVETDKEKLERILIQTKKLFKQGDYKLEKLKQTLTEIFKSAKTEEERKVVLFSYFRTTADYIYDKLIDDTEWLERNKNPKIEKITGITPPKARTDLIERFAPKSTLLDLQGASKVKKQKELKAKEQIDVLISTDVLSEGQNLQDGRFVINYDLHWNPVKLIQRSGRIDRLGCIHKEVGIFNFFPQTGLDRLINLVQRIRRRLSTIDETVGLDADIMDSGDARTQRLYEEEMKKRQEEDEKREDLLKIENEEIEIINEFEERMEVGGDDIAKIKLFGEIKKQGFDYYQNEVPLGIHSGLVNLQYSGILVVVRVFKESVDQLHWMFYSDEEDFRKKFSHYQGLWIDKPRLERLLDNLISEWEEIKKAKFPNKIRYTVEEPQELFKNVVEIVRLFKKTLVQSDKVSRIQSKKPIPGNGPYLQFINKAIQYRSVSESYAKKFIELLFEKNVEILAKEEKVKVIVDEFKQHQKNIDNLIRDMEIDELQKPEIIEKEYEVGAKSLLKQFYEYMDMVGIEIQKEKVTKVEDENLKLVGFVRFYRLEDIEDNSKLKE